MHHLGRGSGLHSTPQQSRKNASEKIKALWLASCNENLFWGLPELLCLAAIKSLPFNGIQINLLQKFKCTLSHLWSQGWYVILRWDLITIWVPSLKVNPINLYLYLLLRKSLIETINRRRSPFLLHWVIVVVHTISLTSKGIRTITFYWTVRNIPWLLGNEGSVSLW